MEQENNDSDDGDIEEFEIVEYYEMEDDGEEEEVEDLGETDSEYESAGEDEEGVSGGASERKNVTFDITLPSTHSYLSHDWDELSGRTVHEDGAIISIPILSFPSVVLMPGQLLPLQLFRDAEIAMIKQCMDRDKTFGQLKILMVPRGDSEGGFVHSLAPVGTTVEILAVKEEEGMPMKVKTVGRQRFEVLEQRTDTGGDVMATVRILPDKNLPELLSTLHHPTAYPYLRCKHHYHDHQHDGVHNNDDDDKINNNNRINNGDDNDAGQQNNASSHNVDHDRISDDNVHNFDNNVDNNIHNNNNHLDANNNHLHDNNNHLDDSNLDNINTYTDADSIDDIGDFKIRNVLKETGKLNKILHSKKIKKPLHLYSPAALTHWPEWVYDQYNCNILMTNIRHELRAWNDKMVTSSVPPDPDNFSYWVASSLPLNDAMRMEVLRINSCQQRLRFELSILRKCTVMCCKYCNQMLAKKDDVFSMSTVGPLGTYVNPGGHIHETLTVYQVSGLHHVGKPSTEASWFPGYAWTIVECSTCYKHMGWRFTMAKKYPCIKPQRFWGLCRAGLTPGLINNEPDQPFQPFIW